MNPQQFISHQILKDLAARSLRVSLIIPVYNAEPYLPHLFEKIRPFANECGFEIVFVDDSSFDNSLDLLRNEAKDAANILVTPHSSNRGQDEATMTGVLSARGEIVVLLDDDLQHRLENIPTLLFRLLEVGPNSLIMGVSQGWRKPLWRSVASQVVNLLSNIFLPKPLPLNLSSFCAFHKDLVLQTRLYKTRKIAFVVALIQKADLTLTVTVENDPSRQRNSRYEFSSLYWMLERRFQYFRFNRVVFCLVFFLATAIACGSGLLESHPSLLTSTAYGAFLIASLLLIALAGRICFVILSGNRSGSI